MHTCNNGVRCVSYASLYWLHVYVCELAWLQVCVCAHSDRSFPVGLVVPNEKNLRVAMERESEREGPLPCSLTELCQLPAAIGCLRDALKRHAVLCGYCYMLLCFPHKYTRGPTL